MLAIALHVILSTLQSQTPSGLQKQTSHPSHWEFHFFCQDCFIFSFGGKPLQISMSWWTALYMCEVCSTMSRLLSSISSHR